MRYTNHVDLEKPAIVLEMPAHWQHDVEVGYYLHKSVWPATGNLHTYHQDPDTKKMKTNTQRIYLN